MVSVPCAGGKVGDEIVLLEFAWLAAEPRISAHTTNFHGHDGIEDVATATKEVLADRGVEEATIYRNDNERIARSIPLVPGLASVSETRMSGSEPSPQQVEIDGLKARDAHLDGMAADRGC